MSKVQVRKATISDLPEVLSLVKELATFEKEPDAVTASLEDYEIALNQRSIMIEVAIINHKIVGTIIMYDIFSTWKGKVLYLEDFIVRESFRGNGIGKILFEKYLQLGRENGYKKLKWQVLDWNVSAIQFYQKFNATIEKEWWNGVIDLEHSI